MPVIQRLCEGCGAAFSKCARPSQLAKGRFRYCSIACANKAKSAPSIRDKACSECGQMKTADHFRKWRSICRSCLAAKQRAYNDLHREAVRAAGARSYRRHPEKQAALAKKWRLANPEKIKACQKKADAKIYARKRAMLLASPERQAKARAAVKSWYERNKDRYAVYFHRRRFRLSLGRNDYTQEQWEACKGYFGHRCAYCLEALPLEMEHMNPISRGGENTDENVVPACEPCNLSKGSRPILQWMLARAVSGGSPC